MAADRAAIIWSPSAQQDLDEIWAYYAQRGTPQIAEKLTRQLFDAMIRLSRHPYSGRTRSDLTRDLRSIIAGRISPSTGYSRVGFRSCEFCINTAT